MEGGADVFDLQLNGDLAAPVIQAGNEEDILGAVKLMPPIRHAEGNGGQTASSLTGEKPQMAFTGNLNALQVHTTSQK
jgi:hypothetical protein